MYQASPMAGSRQAIGKAEALLFHDMEIFTGLQIQLLWFYYHYDLIRVSSKEGNY